MIRPKIGVLMLDTTFERIVGDIGNPKSFSLPVEYQVVSGATVNRVVKEADKKLVDVFIKAGKELQAKGVEAITTSCGFLAIFQREIAKELTVPFYSSSLIQIPIVHSIMGGPIGVLTARKASLTSRHLAGVGADRIPTVIYGMDDKYYFSSAIVEQTIDLDKGSIQQEMVEKAVELYQDHPDIKAIVLECTNMPPYKEAIQREIPLPIFDIFNLTDFICGSFPINLGNYSSIPN